MRNVLDGVVRELTKRYKPERVILYGSWVWGNPTPHSDIDILIIKDSKRGFHERCLYAWHIIKDVIKGVDLIPIVLTPKEVQKRLARGDQFIEKILEDGEIIYAEK